VLALLVCKALTTASISTAAVFRTIEMASPTCFVRIANPSPPFRKGVGQEAGGPGRRVTYERQYPSRRYKRPDGPTWPRLQAVRTEQARRGVTAPAGAPPSLGLNQAGLGCFTPQSPPAKRSNRLFASVS
jgi:hypothetical protein